jgi:aspartyl-tRNA(Asn)/glutamyl-tRNA(Gln) amidotransferase subunit C
MNTKEIEHLAHLARIRLTQEEVAAFASEIDAILQYVQVIDTIVGSTSTERMLGARRNVFREDYVRNEPESFTEALLREAPARKDRYVVVKKIIEQD